MGWLGKFIGGTVGFAIGGPLGAVFGATFGHAIDSGSRLRQANTIQYISPEEKDQLTFFVAAFSMLAKLAKADGRVSREEIDAVEKFIVQELHLQGNSNKIAINIFNAALTSSQTFEGFAHQFYRHFHRQSQMLELMIDIMLRVSVSDGHLSQSEENLLITAANIFNLFERYEQLKSKYITNNINKYYSILGCRKGDSEKDLKKCYRQKVTEYHPDKIAAKGLPEEFTKFTQDKFREIQEAWEHIKKDRKIK